MRSIIILFIFIFFSAPFFLRSCYSPLLFLYTYTFYYLFFLKISCPRCSSRQSLPISIHFSTILPTSYKLFYFLYRSSIKHYRMLFKHYTRHSLFSFMSLLLYILLFCASIALILMVINHPLTR